MAEKDYIEREAALKAVNRHYPDTNAICGAEMRPEPPKEGT